MTLLAFQDVQHAIIALMPDLRRFARSLTQSADAADDLVQTAYERVLTRSGRSFLGASPGVCDTACR
jgi:RNA polymerase sigma-70 factor (ECF subfamily)